MRLILLAAVLCLSACASAGEGRVLRSGGTASLAPGDTVALPDRSTLRFVGLRNDSRCPPGVACIRAGDADVAFEHRDAGTVHEVVLNTERSTSAVLGAWRLGLVSVGAGADGPVEIRIDPAR